MAVDYVIDYRCYPKDSLGTDGLVERIKGRERAEAVIQLFRRNGDQRPVSEIGFEMARSTPEGVEETRVIMVQDLLDRAAELGSLEMYCDGCPANRTGEPFGCVGQIEYPLSGRAEIWLLQQLPTPDEPLPWLMLRQALRDMKSDGTRVNPMRGEDMPYFQEREVLARKLGEIAVNSNQMFELLFMAGHVRPAYAAVLLMLFHGIRRDVNADEMMALSQSPEDGFEQYPFRLPDDENDDTSLRQIKAFLKALYLAWGLNVRLLLDV